ncbi:GAF domain-containing sensor histidine kinase [Dankookia rubra]|uniref:histidine kinase n=1 Tax=Dankookia rubra TaxID=1442381 RepID=A0A4R5QDS7_9PROT|nr:GAF domain-containing sensor histidine kinase [Dankookia rubra]TDH61350.1 GAF domain-containing sensor histidine kinase [Dankookia rubra]
MVTDPDPDPAGDIALVARIGAVPTILQILCDMTGLRFAAVARVTNHDWTACAVLDRIGFGLRPGGQLDLQTTFCDSIRASRQPIVIDHASRDPVYASHPVPRRYGFESYISVPIIRRDGSVFGTICALDPEPARLRDGKVLPTVTLFAELVAAQLEIEERLQASQTALLDAEALGALREQFIAVLGHDLRNPIAAVGAGADLLARHPADARAPEILAQMRRSCRRMATLVDDILDFARGRLGGGIPVRQRRVALDGLLRDVVAELRGTHPDRTVEAAIDLPDLVACDPRRIGQLVSNLLANALVHGAQDRPVSLTAHGRDGGLTLSVTNQGRPIPPAIMARLFQPFSRDANGPRAGLGLGLYIAAEVARAHGGTLSVASDPAATVFTLELPAG